jgi:polyribonucleotide nucleotidyltransferase
LADFRNHHADVQIEASRDKGLISLRGPPDAVQLCKNELLHFALKTETRILVGRESAIVVGRSGATINRLVESHRVTIDVSETGDDVFTCTIIGPAVDAAVAEIDAIVLANKDVTEEITVDQIVRNTLLTDNGIPIKQLQKQVNEAVKDIAGGGVQLTFSKGDSSNVKSALIIKGRQAVMGIAKKMVLEFLEKVQASLVTIDVDPFVVAKIIGKGGEIIKKLKNGRVVNIEVDKILGRVVIQSQDYCEVKRVEAEIRSIMAENQIVRIPLPAARPMFRDLVRSEKKDEINALVWMGLDDDASSLILRGTRENVSIGIFC